MNDAKELPSAWLLPIGNDMTVAIGQYELKYIEYPDNPVSLPGLPAYCEQGFVWRDRFVPILDLLGLVTRRKPPVQTEPPMVAIIAYERAADNALSVGALALRGVPKPLAIDPAQAAPTKALQGAWSLLSLAAFRAENQLYPVLDLRQLFDTTPSELLKLH